MRVVQWPTFKVSTSWVRKMAIISILLGGTIVTRATMANNDK